MKYTQEELKRFFYYEMDDCELNELNKLGIDNIKNAVSSQYKIKYIKNVGYVFIGEGYLIMDDGSEPVTYFAQIFNSKDEAQQHLLNK